MHKHTIVVDVRMINSSGIGTYLKNILPILALEFKLILLGNKEELNSFSWTKNIEVIQFEAKGYSLKEQFIFPRIIPKTKLLWCPHFNAPLLPVRADKIVCTIHDVNHLALKKSTFSIKYKYAKKLIENAIKKSEKLITISEFSKSEILKYTRATSNQISVFHNGIDKGFANKSEIIDIELPKNYFLFVGNVKPHKNLLVLLKAYLLLPENIKTRYKLVVMGKKDGFITGDKNIFRFIKSNKLTKYIFFTGFVPDAAVSQVYKNAHLFIFPSNYEGFGLPLLEAMATETPVICSNIASFKEVADTAALYFRINDAENLKEKIELLLANDELRTKLIDKGKQRVENFDWLKAGNLHIELFRTLLEN